MIKIARVNKPGHELHNTLCQIQGVRKTDGRVFVTCFSIREPSPLDPPWLQTYTRYTYCYFNYKELGLSITDYIKLKRLK